MPKFLSDIVLDGSDIDLAKNELKAAKIENLASDPATPTAGQVYFNTSDGRLKVYDGASWRFASGLFSNADIASDAAIALSKLATDPLDRANHTGTQIASTISDFDTQVQTNTLDSLAAPDADLDLDNQKITNLADPVSDQDAATKAYVDASRSGLDVKQSVRAATTANITLSGEQTIDGVSVVAGNRVLVKDQSTGSANGIYVASASGWTRATDANQDAEVTAGMFTFVEEGTANADAGFVLSTNGAITVGTTALSFSQFSGAGQITAGDGLSKTGNTLNVGGTTDRITVNADTVDIASTYAGQNTITTLGTIATGVWNGTDIAVADGGTGASTAQAARVNLGASAELATAVLPQKLAFTIGDNSTTTFTVTHNMNTRDVVISVHEVGSPYDSVYADISHATANTVTLSFSTAPATNEYRVVVIG
jgi:hypothetical protein